MKRCWSKSRAALFLHIEAFIFGTSGSPESMLWFKIFRYLHCCFGLKHHGRCHKEFSSVDILSLVCFWSTILKALWCRCKKTELLSFGNENLKKKKTCLMIASGSQSFSISKRQFLFFGGMYISDLHLNEWSPYNAIHSPSKKSKTQIKLVTTEEKKVTISPPS